MHILPESDERPYVRNNLKNTLAMKPLSPNTVSDCPAINILAL